MIGHCYFVKHGDMRKVQDAAIVADRVSVPFSAFIKKSGKL